MFGFKQLKPRTKLNISPIADVALVATSTAALEEGDDGDGCGGGDRGGSRGG